MSIGALKMPAMAETVPDSAREPGVLRAEGAEVLHHRHAALEQRQVVLLR